MIRHRIYCLFIFSIFFSNYAFAEEDTVVLSDQFQLVAEVNGFQITNQNLEKEIISFFGYEFQFLSMEQQQQLKKLYLQKSIDRHLLESAAHKKYTKRNPRNLINDYLNQFVFKNIKVEDSEVGKEYLAKQADYLIPEQLMLKEIFIKKSTDNLLNNEGNRKLAENVYLEAQSADESFDELAKEYSTKPNYIHNKSNDFITPNQLPPGVSRAALPTTIGSVSPVIETKDGFYIFKLIEVKPAKQIPFDDVKKELKKKLLGKRKATAYRAHLNALRRQAKIIVYLN